VWHHACVLIAIVIGAAIVVVLAAVVLVAAGHGGEMPMQERTDYAPLDMGPVSATDVVLLRPPTALWGYSQQATDEALERIAGSIRERDVRIVALEQLVTDLSRQPAEAAQPGGWRAAARHARAQDGLPEKIRDGGEGGPAAGPQADRQEYPGSPQPCLPPWTAGPGRPPGASRD
jgi:hypothetical protein